MNFSAIFSFRFIVMCSALLCLPVSQAHAVADIYYYCDTPKDYKKLLKYYQNYRDPSDQIMDYLRKKIPKSEISPARVKQEMQNLSRNFKPSPPNPPKVACEKIPGNKLLRVKGGGFSDMTCVKPPSSATCKWINKLALQHEWKLSLDGKVWHRR